MRCQLFRHVDEKRAIGLPARCAPMRIVKYGAANRIDAAA
jgi:hypothetical protein